MLEKGVRVMGAECDFEQDLGGRDAPWPASRPIDVQPHLLVARASISLLFGAFSNRPTNVCCPVRPAREAVELVEESHRDPRGEEAHDPTVPDDLPRVCDGFVPKP